MTWTLVADGLCMAGRMLVFEAAFTDWEGTAVLVQFAVQIAVCFGKVARQDFPKMWPSLFEDLTRHMQSGSALANRRVYLVLHHVLKELATKRLATDKKHFAQVHSLSAPPAF